MNSIQNYNMQQNIAFQGQGFQKAKTLLENQAAHLITQSMSWGAIEAMQPSTNMTEVIGRKICIDIGEFVAHIIANYKKVQKMGFENTPFNISNHGLNIISYVKALAKLISNK